MNTEPMTGKPITFNHQPKKLFGVLKVNLDLTDDYRAKLTYSLICDYCNLYQSFNLDAVEKDYGKEILKVADLLIKERVHIANNNKYRAIKIPDTLKELVPRGYYKDNCLEVDRMSCTEGSINECLLALKTVIYQTIINKMDSKSFKKSVKMAEIEFPESLITSNKFEIVRDKGIKLIEKISALDEKPDSHIFEVIEKEVYEKLDLVWAVYCEARELGSTSFIDNRDCDAIAMELLDSLEERFDIYDFAKIEKSNEARIENLNRDEPEYFSSERLYCITDMDRGRYNALGDRELASRFGIRFDAYLPSR